MDDDTVSAFTVIVVPNWLVFTAIALAVLNIAASLARIHYLRKLGSHTPTPQTTGAEQ